MTERKARSRLAQAWTKVYGVLLGLLFVVLSTAIILFPFFSREQYKFEVGDIASEEIRAPRAVSYISVIETQAEIETALAGVVDVYDPPDPRIGRQQVRRADQVMDFIADVRADPFAEERLKLDYFSQIVAPPILSDETAMALLTVSDSQYELVRGQVVTLVEEAMSEIVKEGQVSEVTDQLELKVKPDLPEELIPLSVTVARDLVAPNSFLNQAETESQRAAAVAGVEEIEITYEPGEVVIRGGSPVDALKLEALQALDLTRSQITGDDIASAVLASLLSAVVVAVYLMIFGSRWLEDRGGLTLIVLLVLIFLAVAQAMVPGGQSEAYLFPMAALSMVLAGLMGVELAGLITVVLAMLIGYMAGGSLEMATFFALSGALAAGSLRRAQRLNSFFRSGIFAAIIGVAVILVFRLPAQTQPSVLGPMLLMALLNGLLSAGIALVLLYLIGNLTGLTTSIQLIDLMRPDHPLQKRLQNEALGTYQHTLSVANLAEAAAESIGANTLLARIGTLYHDVGKMRNPGFFGENRLDLGLDPHKGLSPVASARIIRAHVPDGLDLARRHRLPPNVTAFISEHHGTMPILYFLNAAQNEAEAKGVTLDESEFCYDGPRPQSRETAIVMLADSCESAARGNRPGTEEEIIALVEKIVQQRLDYNQLDESDLTLTDLTKIKETFVRTFKGMYHPRVKYPEDRKSVSDAEVELKAEYLSDLTMAEGEEASNG